MILTEKEDLIMGKVMNSSLGCSPREIVQIKIPRSERKVSSRVLTLDFR